MRLVLDTVVIVAAMRSDRGASRALLLGALDGRFRPLVSVPLMIEYEAVLMRPEHLQASGVSAADVAIVLDALASIVEPVRLAFLWRPTLRDPNDDMVLETAANGQADAIVTFNARDFSAARQFDFEIIRPAEALIRMKG